MIEIKPGLAIHEDEMQFSFICSPGPGGQNVNKVATAVVLRFNLKDSPSLPGSIRLRLLQALESRLTSLGEIIIKAHRHRTQERNKQDAIDRLIEIIKNAATPPKPRRATKPTYASKQRRLTKKKQAAQTKSLRQGKIDKDH